MRFTSEQVNSTGEELKALLRECGHDVTDLNDIERAMSVARTVQGVAWRENDGSPEDATAIQIYQAYIALQQ